MEFLDEHSYFMAEAYLVGMRSKDPATHVGAIIVGKDGEIISKGYNGPPRKTNDNDPNRFKRPLKYRYVEHAERNAIYNSSRIGVSTKECIMYTTFLPCCDCIRAIIQSGIQKLFLDKRWQNKRMHMLTKEDEEVVDTLIKESGLVVKYVDVEIPCIIALFDGTYFDLSS